jgi:hypothetical protein
MKTKQMLLQIIGLTLLTWLLVGCGASVNPISETPQTTTENQAATATTATSVNEVSLAPDEPVSSAAETTYTADVCLNSTRHEGECKDCCDSLNADGAGRKACRDACPTHDFAQNTDFITVSAPSSLGPEGDYSLCTVTGDERTCKDCCDSSPDLQSGDRRFCRDAAGDEHRAGHLRRGAAQHNRL